LIIFIGNAGKAKKETQQLVFSTIKVPGSEKFNHLGCTKVKFQELG
jgi:hypothetical protein